MAASISRERRKNVRYKGKRQAILVNPDGMHNIRNISEGGLCFLCSEEEFFPQQWPVEIIYAGTRFYLQGVTVRLVREEIKDGDTLITTPAKEVGVEFVDLDETSEKALQQLLNYHIQRKSDRANLGVTT